MSQLSPNRIGREWAKYDKYLHTVAYPQRVRHRDAEPVLRHGPRARDGGAAAVSGDVRRRGGCAGGYRGVLRRGLQPVEALDVALLRPHREAQADYGSRVLRYGSARSIWFRDGSVADAGAT